VEDNSKISAIVVGSVQKASQRNRQIYRNKSVIMETTTNISQTHCNPCQYCVILETDTQVYSTLVQWKSALNLEAS